MTRTYHVKGGPLDGTKYIALVEAETYWLTTHPNVADTWHLVPNSGDMRYVDIAAAIGAYAKHVSFLGRQRTDLLIYMGEKAHRAPA